MARGRDTTEEYKRLENILRDLEKVVKSNTGNIEKLTKSHNKNTTAVKKNTKANKKHKKSNDEIGEGMTDITNRGRLLRNSFATIRSKLLLFNFAMGLGIKQLAGFARESSRLISVNNAFDTLSGVSEDSAEAIAKLQAATNGTMSSFDLFKQANNAMVLGVSKNSDEMAELFDVAQRLGRALGQDTVLSVESLVTGIGRQSRQMLDNIGIIVKADEAYENFAAKIGVTASNLTNAQKKQAFFEATMDSARQKVKLLGDEQLTAQEKFAQFDATLDNLQMAVGQKVTPVVLSFLEGTAEFMKEIMETDLETALRQLREMGASVEQITELQELIALEEVARMTEKNAKKIKQAIEGSMLFPSKLTAETIKALNLELSRQPDLTRRESNEIERLADNFDPFSIEVENVNKRIAELLELTRQLDLSNSKTDRNRLTFLKEEIMELQNIKGMLEQNNKLKQVPASPLSPQAQPMLDEKNALIWQGEDTQVAKTAQELRSISNFMDQFRKDATDTEIEAIEREKQFQLQKARDLKVEKEDQFKIIKFFDKKIEAFEEKKRQEELDKRHQHFDNLQAQTTTFFNQQFSNATNQLNLEMNRDIEHMKATNEFKLAQKRNDVDKMEDLEKQAASKTLNRRTKMFRMEQALAVSNIIIDYLQAMAKDSASQGIWAFATSHPLHTAASAMSIATVMAQKPPAFAEGGDFITSGPQMIMVGDNPGGRERVQVTPLSSENKSGPQVGQSLVVNVSGNVLTQDFVTGELAENIKEAVRRGTDFGIG